MNAFERLKEARHAGRPTGAAYVAALFENPRYSVRWQYVP